MTSAVLGWDIGGVNTKVARIDYSQAAAPQVVSIAYELQRDLSALPSVLRSAADQLGAGSHDQHGITMTAELSRHSEPSEKAWASCWTQWCRCFRPTAYTYTPCPENSSAPRPRGPGAWTSRRRTGPQRRAGWPAA